MDHYTVQTKKWLEQRFGAEGADVYYAHQPIYGYRVQPSEPNHIVCYVVSYSILKALARLRFSSLLDVGGAEGYKSALVKQFFSANVLSADVSEEACKLARHIYQIPAQAVDIHRLPFADNSFEVVLCSETLKHVPDFEGATKELLRVARKAVVITVPKESEKRVKRNIALAVPHGHIHALRSNSFDFCKPELHSIRMFKTNHIVTKALSVPVEAMELQSESKLFSALFAVNNALCPLLRKMFGQKSAERLIRFDSFLSAAVAGHSGMTFILEKEAGAYHHEAERNLKISDLMNFTVPRFLFNDKK